MAWSDSYVTSYFELRRSRLLMTADLSGAHGCEKKHHGSLKTPADFLKLLSKHSRESVTDEWSRAMGI